MKRNTAKAVAYLIKHPDASPNTVAAACGVSSYVVRKLIRERQTPVEVLTDTTTAGKRLLDTSMATYEQRGREYGPAAKSMHSMAAVWSAILGHYIPPHMVPLMLMGMKMVRVSGNPNHADSVVDIAGYAAVLADVIAEGSDE